MPWSNTATRRGPTAGPPRVPPAGNGSGTAGRRRTDASITLTATGRSSQVSSPRYTVDIPPVAIGPLQQVPPVEEDSLNGPSARLTLTGAIGRTRPIGGGRAVSASELN